MDKKAANKIYKLLKKHYPATTTAITYHDPFELLVATILSAQCTDKRVNIVTGNLFKKYKTISSYAEADPKEFEQDIRSTGFYKNKAKNIIAASSMILKEFGGAVPDTMEELIRLPGVARKTANIVLYHGHGKTEGIAVDTHVKRVSKRLGLTCRTDPVKIENDLMSLFEKGIWGEISNLIIDHGRAVCNARKPLCGECFLNDICPAASEFIVE